MQRMLKEVLIASLLSLAAIPALHAKQPNTDYTQSTQPSENDLESHGRYRNKDGREVHSPSKSKSGKIPAGASAQCRDGTYSFSAHHRGTCSRHGGVAAWLQ